MLIVSHHGAIAERNRPSGEYCPEEILISAAVFLSPPFVLLLFPLAILAFPLSLLLFSPLFLPFLIVNTFPPTIHHHPYNTKTQTIEKNQQCPGPPPPSQRPSRH